MRIIERYPARFKLLKGQGRWALLYPAKLVLSWFYRLWLLARGRGGKAEVRVSRVNLPSRTLSGPRVVSVGNLEIGGGGKTPCTLCLAQKILARGGTPVVISRGYGGSAARSAPCIVPAGRPMNRESGGGYITEGELLSRVGGSPAEMGRIAALLGDEIVLFRTRGIPVVIAADRGRGAELAARLFSATHVLLDDAFQNRSITKDVDILLLDAERPFGDGHLLPLGVLRELPSAIGRADVVIFTRAHGERVPLDAERFVRGKHVFFASHEPVDLLRRTGEAAPLSFLRDRECILFSGIARPESFERLIVALGGRARLAFRFLDHFRYAEKDIRRMIREAGGGASFIATEKDWVKARDLFPPEVELYALRVEMRISKIEKLIDILASSSS